jgi:hypothetical protein
MPEVRLDAINLLAGQAVGFATAFLHGRHDAERLAGNAACLSAKLMVAREPGDVAVNAILDPVRLLVIAMTHAARVADAARADRWRDVMRALVELVRGESLALLPREEGASP